MEIGCSLRDVQSERERKYEKQTLEDKRISFKCGSLCLVARGAVYNLAAATMPYAFLAIVRLYRTPRYDWRVWLLVVLPFFGCFTGIGIFWMAGWAIAIVVYVIHKRKLLVNLLAGFLAVCVGTVLVELRLFYAVLSGETWNRSIMPPKSGSMN